MHKNNIILSIVSIIILFGLIAYGSVQMKKPLVVENDIPSQMDRGYTNEWTGSVQPPENRPQQPPAADEDGVMCTMDARECPDGSYVGRTGPHCEFTPCPGN